MAFIITADGKTEKFAIEASIYPEAQAAKLTVEEFLNQKYGADVDMKYGSPFKQILASEGMLPAAQNKFGIRSKTLDQVLNNIDGASAAANVDRKTDPFGSQSRVLFPIAVIAAIEDAVQPDRTTDDVVFRQMAATKVSIAGDTYAQPILDYNVAGGPNTLPNGAKAGRVVQMGQVPTMMTLTTSDKYNTIPTYGIGIEFSDKALKNSTLDLFTLSLNRYLQIEKDQRVYTYISQLFAGDADQGTSAIPTVTSNSLDSASTGGVLTHRAWVKFLAANRKKRHLDYLICDIDTYLKVESRTGRPGSNSYDPTLARIDPQLIPASPVPFGADVKWMIVDSAAEGGPVPANTIWALDSKQAFMLIENTDASYTATEAFVLRRSTSMVWHWSEEARRLFPTDLTAFSALLIS